MNEKNERKKVYMAGQDVFRPNQAQFLAANKEILINLGFTPLSPMDNEIAPNNGEKAVDNAIYKANITMIKDCDIVIANCNDFRGKCLDDGTACEIGVAAVLGKRIFGYRSDLTPMSERIGKKDENGWSVEDFERPINLMIYNAIRDSGGALVLGDFETAAQYASDHFN